MKKKHVFLLLVSMIISTTYLFNPTIEAKEKTTSSKPGTAIFVMAIPTEINVSSQKIKCSDESIYVDIQYPKIEGFSDKKFEKIINGYLKKNSIKTQKDLTKEAKNCLKETKSKGLTARRYELIQNFTIRDTIQGYFVVELFEYAYTGGDEGVSTQKYIVIDISRNKVVLMKECDLAEKEVIKQINHMISSY